MVKQKKDDVFYLIIAWFQEKVRKSKQQLLYWYNINELLKPLFSRLVLFLERRMGIYFLDVLPKNCHLFKISKLFQILNPTPLLKLVRQLVCNSFFIREQVLLYLWQIKTVLKVFQIQNIISSIIDPKQEVVLPSTNTF